MGEAQSGSCNDFVEDCIFCTIASNQDKYTTIIKQNDELACFRDICPAAPHHYLVIPKQHIISCRSLQSTHVGLVERMAGMGRVVLHDRGITDMSDIRLGFHRPPYTSVDHLHLHVLAPASKISHFMLHKFTPGTDRFVNEDHLRRCLLKAAPKTSIRCASRKYMASLSHHIARWTKGRQAKENK
uniref:HIT domain-containing protein n=1 Tax=Myripristis murdjan TaxID=586833 RepID=A0A668ARJ7_9TELE